VSHAPAIVATSDTLFLNLLEAVELRVHPEGQIDRNNVPSRTPARERLGS
jgi:hypothetical protein